MGFGARLRKQLVDPTVFTLPIVAPVFWGARRLELIASPPVWLLCGLLFGGFVLSCVTTALWRTFHEGWRLWARVGEQAFGISVVMYAIGWGPMLAIGLIFGAVEAIRLSGSRAVTPAMLMSVLALGVGQL